MKKTLIITMPLVFVTLFGVYSTNAADNTTADKSEQLVTKQKLKNFFGKKGMFNGIAESRSDAAVSDVVTDNILGKMDLSRVSDFVGEEMTVDTAKVERNFGQRAMDYGMSKNWSYEFNPDNSKVVVRNLSKSYSDGLKGQSASEKTVLSRAQDDLNKLGFDTDRISEMNLDVHKLGRFTRDQNGAVEGQTIAYKVVAKRTIDGIEVRGNRVLLTYCMDGSLKGMSMVWPDIEEEFVAFDRIDSIDEDTMIDRAEVALRGQPLRKYIDSLETEVIFVVEDGVLKRKMALRGAVSGPEGVGTGELDEVTFDL